METTSRRRVLASVAGLLLVAVVLSGCLSAEAQDIFDRTNATRSAERKRQLTEDTKLDAKAQAQAEAMARQHKLYHSDLRANVPAGYLTLGENVARGSNIDVIYRGWLSSTEHHANISNNAYSRIGVGIVKGDDGLWYAVQVFWG